MVNSSGVKTKTQDWRPGLLNGQRDFPWKNRSLTTHGPSCWCYCRIIGWASWFDCWRKGSRSGVQLKFINLTSDWYVVGEFGWIDKGIIMGEKYASAGEMLYVTVIRETLPFLIQQSFALPETKVGAILALADKLIPSFPLLPGFWFHSIRCSNDPYAPSSQHKGFVRILMLLLAPSSWMISD